MKVQFMNSQRVTTLVTVCFLAVATAALTGNEVVAQAKQPNIILLISDDTGWGDPGCYGGGEGRGMATPNLDRMAREGMQFWSFYGQPSCTPGRAAIQTGRFPNRSGMTTVAFPGEGGGLPKEEWTLGSMLKTAGYDTFFVGKWHLGEADHALPIAHGYDMMKNTTLYHLNSYTYADPEWNADMSDEMRAFYVKVTQGALEGEAGGKRREIRKLLGKDIPGLDGITEKYSLEYIRDHAKSDKPFFMSVNFAKNHQPNIPAPEFKHKSASKTAYADSLVELDTRIGRILDELRSLGIAENTFVLWTADNGAWQDVYPDCGYTPFRGTKGSLREGGSRMPALAWWPSKIKAGQKSHEIVGTLDFMPTFAKLAGVELPTKDRAGEPTMFDGFDMSPLLFGQGQWKRKHWFYFSEDELSPGAVRVGRFKGVYNLRGDNGAVTGGLAVDTNIGWKGPKKYVATVPQVFDLWSDPQERYDIFMTTFTEKTWAVPSFAIEVNKLMKTYAKFPPRKKQSQTYAGPITLTDYERYTHIKEQLEKQGFNLGFGGDADPDKEDK